MLWPWLLPCAIRCKSTMIFPDIQIWPLDWEKCSALSLRKTLIIHTFPVPFVSSGDVGIFRLVLGSENMCIFLLEEIGKGK